jgi:hypothetical protein
MLGGGQPVDIEVGFWVSLNGHGDRESRRSEFEEIRCKCFDII